jgi:hypothetical protein
MSQTIFVKYENGFTLTQCLFGFDPLLLPTNWIMNKIYWLLISISQTKLAEHLLLDGKMNSLIINRRLFRCGNAASK